MPRSVRVAAVSFRRVPCVNPSAAKGLLACLGIAQGACPVAAGVHTEAVSESEGQARTVVLTDVRDENGTVWRAVTLTEDGGLAIRGHDLGRGVEDFFGGSEYEFERRLSAQETKAVSELLSVPVEGDLLAAISGRFPSGSGLEDFIKEHGIESQFWSRVG